MGNGVVRSGSYAADTSSGTTATKMNDQLQVPCETGSPSMERVKKILSSPLTRKKNTNKYFGVHLEELAKRENEAVPLLVRRVCQYIENSGFDHIGLFRVNGNVRVVEQLKTSFDKSGNADLEACMDVMAAAGLLKLFFRELPDAVIPESMTQLFVHAQTSNKTNDTEFLHQTRTLLTKLPEPNFSLLKYLCHFLVKVTLHEELNKMNATGLGIVFGPNLFSLSAPGQPRCAAGLAGLSDQGVTNQIVKRFITDYNALFLEEGEISPYPGQQKPKKLKGSPPPPRPPPPVFHVETPVPAQRKNLKKEDLTRNKSNSNGTGEVTPSPRLSDEEAMDTQRSQSPFVLDSDRSEASAVPTPRVSAAVAEMVEKVISSSVQEHLFGESEDEISEEDSPVHNNVNAVKSYEAEGRGVQRMTIDDQGSVVTMSLTHEPEHDTGSSISRPVPKPRLKKPTTPKDLSECDEPVLSMTETAMRTEAQDQVQNAAPRPLPSRRSLGAEFADQPSQVPEVSGDDSLPEIDDSEEDQEDSEVQEDENHNATKPSISFLNIHPHANGEGRQKSPERSPGASRKPFVPPLDLSILHEHGDGSDPIPAVQGPSLAVQKVMSYKEDPEEVVLSPRTSKLKKKPKPLTLPACEDTLSPSAFRVVGFTFSAHCNTDVPPSPPTDQPVSSKSGHRTSADENTLHLKMLHKRIQMHKKKIKQFEENFEEQHGYKPSHSDKVGTPEIRKILLDLTKTRKEIKQLKEEVEAERYMPDALTPSQLSDDPELLPAEHGKSSMEQALHKMLHTLQEKRQAADRPYDLILMSMEQIKEEKLAVQKALLHFESIYGRPSNKAEKELMKPVYDRYRTVKRMLAKPWPRDRMKELQPVPEEHTMDFSPSTAGSEKSNKEPICIPSGQFDDDEAFLVTRDVGALRDMLKMGYPGSSPKISEHVINDENQVNLDTNSKESSLHEMKMPQLLDEQYKAKAEKKRLRRVLRDFEETFSKQMGRQVMKEDRAPMEIEYQEYKQIKARIKLLDALISKHDTTMVN